jgi:hypothetical protein
MRKWIFNLLAFAICSTLTFGILTVTSSEAEAGQCKCRGDDPWLRCIDVRDRSECTLIDRQHRELVCFYQEGNCRWHRPFRKRQGVDGAEQVCGRHGTCSPITRFTGPRLPPHFRGTPVRTCRGGRCGPAICYDFCP